MNKTDLSTPLRIHVVGAGGAGMGAIASVLRAMGHDVSGSDLKDGPIVQRLRAEGVPVAVGHDPDLVDGVDLVAISSAIPERNAEVRAARDAGVAVLRRSDILPAIAATKRTVAVGGTHGKTTTSSMLALILVEAGLRPSFIIGGDVNEIGTGASWDDGDWFVVEADESDKTFLALGAEVAVVTNAEPDHLDTYGGDPRNLHDAFVEFAASAEVAVICLDDPGSARLDDVDGSVGYGTAEGADYRIVEVERGRSHVGFALERTGEPLGRITMPSPGLHNARNAAAAAAVALEIGAPFDAVQRALSRFGGVARRFEFRGEVNGITFVDDYAHLPTEVSAAIDAGRDGGWDRIVVVFQPHRFSRTASLHADFAGAFAGSDLLVVTDIYAAGETPRPGVTGELIADAVRRTGDDLEVRWIPRLDDVVVELVDELQPGDLCLTLGAGDLTAVPDVVIDRLRGPEGGSGS